MVLAAGAWAGRERTLGIKIQMTPIRGQILLLGSTKSLYPRHILRTLRWTYAVPWPNQRLLVGSTLESAGFDNRVTRKGKKDILERSAEILEGIGSLPVERSWAGLRPRAKGGKPLIGPTPTRGLFLALGFYRSGILFGPLVGKLLAQGIHSGKFSPLIKAFYLKQ